VASRQTGSKGNPAHKRMMNAALKSRRERSYRRGQERKAARRAEQARREVINKDLRKKGLLTPWEVAKAKRTS
jgi:hypothetical protein